MPSITSEENQIFSVFSSQNLPQNTAFGHREFEHDGTKYFIAASLYSAHISDLEKNLDAGLDFFEANHNFESSDLLGEMKKTLFSSGDYLADYLIKQKLPVDDVDYSVCFLAFRNGIVYVWLDGDLNVRIYRGQASILINENREPQFYGSTTTQLGDIIAVSSFKNLENEDQKVESYVLKESEPEYPGLFLDYQIDNNSAELPSPEMIHEYSHSNPEPGVEIEEESMMYSDGESVTVDRMAQIRASLSGFKDKISSSSERLKESGILDKIKEYSEIAWRKTWDFLMSVSSVVLDFIFGIIYRNSPAKLKRFQGSTKKKNLQVLTIVVLFVLIAYLLFFRGLFGGNEVSTGSTNTQANGTQTDNQASIKADLQSKFNDAKTYHDTAQVALFNQAYTDLQTAIDNARSSGFNDTTFLNTISTNAKNLEYDLFHITGIKKADIVYVASGENASLVDFSNINSDVYAIDRNNGQVLKGNPGSLTFDTFASDSELTAMSHIACAITSCYITDDNIGLVILNLQTKTFSKFTSNATLKAAGQGVEEIQIYTVQNNVYVYTLIPTESKVIKYTRSGDGFKTPETWNKVAGFGSDTTDFAIDGGIFEMSSTGTLRRFFGGNIDSGFSGLEAPLETFGTNLQIATTPARATAPTNINRFYVADGDNSRIAVFQKDLDANNQYPFLGSYKYDGEEQGVSFAGIKQISLSGDEKVLFVLSGNVVFGVNVSAV